MGAFRKNLQYPRSREKREARWKQAHSHILHRLSYRRKNTKSRRYRSLTHKLSTRPSAHQVLRRARQSSDSLTDRCNESIPCTYLSLLCHLYLKFEINCSIIIELRCKCTSQYLAPICLSLRIGENSEQMFFVWTIYHLFLFVKGYFRYF